MFLSITFYYPYNYISPIQNLKFFSGKTGGENYKMVRKT
ncbi:hypothetical protein MmTuc01_0549 [Methanosarcina mazei Tuc01]|uniref:Uncharacterized protein n=1 Tax=Methanosarcina mazei Tuc01 TaxID=1236903 RepID=M1QG59_METMZ|nr:hypothetical protein MmTuc01_0549 [Methanosarcina mazei Tuc01]